MSWGIFPNDAAVVRLVGAVLLEQNDDWQMSRLYLRLETLAAMLAPSSQSEPTHEEAA